MGLRKPKSKTLEFLAHHTRIAVPNVLRQLVDSEKRYMVLMGRVKGQILEDAWSTLSETEERTIADQVAEALKQLRSFESTNTRDVDQGPIYSGWLFGDPEKPFGPFSSDSELCGNLHHNFINPLLRCFLNARWRTSGRVPDCRPYVTHGPLNSGSIVVENGKLPCIGSSMFGMSNSSGSICIRCATTRT